jgi:hypothetical protein
LSRLSSVGSSEFLGLQFTFVRRAALHLRGMPFVPGRTVELGLERVELGDSPMEISRSEVDLLGALLYVHSAPGCA